MLRYDIAIIRILQNLRTAQDSKDTNRLCLALHGDQVQLRKGEMTIDGKGGLFPNHDTNTIALGLTFQSGGKVDRVAQHGIVEALR